jgi:hypothetical protein
LEGNIQVLHIKRCMFWWSHYSIYHRVIKHKLIKLKIILELKLGNIYESLEKVPSLSYVPNKKASKYK